MSKQTTFPQPGRRISLVGTSGSGKSFVAQALAQRLRLTYICNDAIIWGPNWYEVPKDEVLRAVDQATLADAWTFDGNLSPRAEDRLVIERCDTIVWLDLPRREVHWQVIRRTLGRVFTREALWHGNRESCRTMLSRDSIIWWSLKTYAGRRRAYEALFADPALARIRRIRLRSRAQVDRWLAGLSC
jgi:adenylate kinase family enzyme